MNAREAVVAFLTQNLPPPQAVDIFCTEADGLIDTAAALGLLLRLLHAEGGPDLYPCILALMPAELSLDTARDACLAELMRIGAPEKHAEALIAKRCRFLNASSFEFNAVLEAIDSAGDCSAVVLPFAAKYRDSQPHQRDRATPGPVTPFGETIRTFVEEDEWSDALTTLAGRLQTVADEKTLYILLLSGSHSPVKEENTRRMQAIKGAVGGTRSTKDPMRTITAREHDWRQQAIDGNESSAFAEIEALGLDAQNLSLLRAQVLFSAGRGAEAYQLAAPYVEELLLERAPGTHINLARMALQAGEHDLSMRLLAAAIAGRADDEITLRSIHQHARTIHSAEHQREALARLRQFFPNSEYTLSVQTESLLHSRHYVALATLLEPHAQAGDAPAYLRYAYALASYFRSDREPNYGDALAAVASTAPDFADKAVLHCAGHAIERGALADGVMLMVGWPWDGTAHGAACKLVILALSRWALSFPPANPPHVREAHEATLGILASALPLVLSYLALHPEDGPTRIDLTNTLAADRMGLYGLAILATHFARWDPAPVFEPAEKAKESCPAATSEEYADFFSRFFRDWGPTPLLGPARQLNDEFNAAPLESLRTAAAYAAQALAASASADADEKQALFMHLRIALDLMSHLGLERERAQLVRIVAAGRANAGALQDARDIAENALMSLGSAAGSADLRAAWLIFADVYARVGNLLEGIIGCLCAGVHRDVVVPAAEAGHDILLQVRILRDMGQSELALDRLRLARSVFGCMASTGRIGVLTAHLEASIQFTKLMENSGLDGLGATQLDLASSLALAPLRLALDSEEDPYPTATLVAQLVAEYALASRQPPPELVAGFAEAMGRVEPNESVRLRLFASDAPTESELLEVCATLRGTRSSADVDSDLRLARIVAGRALAASTKSGNGGAAVLAIELSAVHGVGVQHSSLAPSRSRPAILDDLQAATSLRLADAVQHSEREAQAQLLVKLLTSADPGGDTSIARLLGDPTIPSKVIADLHIAGLDVTACAISRHGLVRVDSAGGCPLPPVMEAAETFNERRLSEWRHAHPFCYCAPDGRNDARGTLDYLGRSLESLGSTARPHERPLVYLLENDLSDFPASFLQSKAQLLSAPGPTALVPSLTWLHATLATKPAVSSSRTFWILPPSEEALIPPLAVLRDNAAVELATRGVDVVCELALPVSHRGGQLVIVGAHGSIWDSNAGFRAVADDDGVGHYSITDFADQLAGTAVAVLLVCSGGRLDRDRLTLGATGLPYELLRRGCRAVVGSPWPLDVGVAELWVRHFIVEWDAGARVVDAVHAANNHVREREPGRVHHLAMRVIGNPLEQLASVGDRPDSVG